MPSRRPTRFPSNRQRRDAERFYDDPQIEAYIGAQPWEVSTSYDVPDLGGYSLKPGKVYVDRGLAEAAPAIDGVPFDQWVFALTGFDLPSREIGSEVAEKAAMDVWQMDHETAREVGRALEHTFIVDTLGLDWGDYEKVIAPFAKRAETGAIENPPKDLDCRPYLQDPDAQDVAILKKLRDRHVIDAFHQDGDFHPSKIGARQAEDGEFYVPDFGRPGKHMRVRTG